MDYGKKFMVNEAVVLLSYAYAVSGYPAAAAVFGFGSAFLAVWWHSAGRLLNNFYRILRITAVQIPFILVSGFSGRAETIVLLAFCNTIVSTLWMESSLRALRETMRILLITFPVFVFLALVTPAAVTRYVTGSWMEKSASLVLVMLIFAPVVSAYLMRIHKTMRFTKI